MRFVGLEGLDGGGITRSRSESVRCVISVIWASIL
jgi:hypothetical protein